MSSVPQSDEEVGVAQDAAGALGELVGRAASSPGSVADGVRVVELGWPRETLILIIYRGTDFFVPNGATLLKPGDRLIVLASKTTVDDLRRTVEAGS